MKMHFRVLKGDGLVRICSVCVEHCPKLWKHALFLHTWLITTIFTAQKKRVPFTGTVQSAWLHVMILHRKLLST